MSTLLERALSTTDWQDLGFPAGYALRESAIIHDGTDYCLLWTAWSYGQPSVGVFKGPDLPTLLESTPFPVKGGAAPWEIKYPSVALDGTTFHLWACAGASPQTRHLWTAAPLTPASIWQSPQGWGNAFGTGANQIIDASVRKHPTNGYWYALGFVNGADTPLVLLRATSPSQAVWNNMGDIFTCAGEPAWASASRPDPNLAFTADGKAWALFTGKMEGGPYRPGIVELDLEAGRAKGCAVPLDNPLRLSDLTHLAVSGQPDRLVGFSNDNAESGTPIEGEWHWGCLELPQ